MKQPGAQVLLGVLMAFLSSCAPLTGVSLIQEENSLLGLVSGTGLPNVLGNMLTPDTEDEDEPTPSS